MFPMPGELQETDCSTATRLEATSPKPSVSSEVRISKNPGAEGDHVAEKNHLKSTNINNLVQKFRIPIS